MKLFKTLIIALIGTIFLFNLSACKSHQDEHTIKVGTVAGPETALMEVAKKVAKEKYGLNIEIVEFNDYTTPNIALNDGSIDANMFQHQPYLDAEIKNRGFQLISIGKTFVYPMGIYSKKINNLKAIQKGDRVAIPNDPSNEARALLLLQKAKLIQLKRNAGVTATTANIVKNPYQLKFEELNAAQLVRTLKDVTIAVINTNYAIPAGLSPSKALFTEDKDSPYANIIVVRENQKDKTQLNELVKALHSKPVLEKAKQLFGDAAIPAWKVSK